MAGDLQWPLRRVLVFLLIYVWGSAHRSVHAERVGLEDDSVGALAADDSLASGDGSAATDGLDVNLNTKDNSTDRLHPPVQEEKAVAKPDMSEERQGLVLHAAHKRPLPPFALVATGGIFQASLKKITESLAYKVMTVFGQAADTTAGWVGTGVGGVLMFATQGIGCAATNILDYISWGGVAGAGWNAVDAMAAMLDDRNDGCMKAVNGAAFVVSVGTMALSIASLTSLAGLDGGTTAGFIASLVGTVWDPIQKGLEQWCMSKKKDDDFKVSIPATTMYSNEEDLNAVIQEQFHVQKGKRQGKNSDAFMTPEEATEVYKDKINAQKSNEMTKSFSKMLTEEREKPAKCMADLFSCKIGAISDYHDMYCGSAWSM